MTYRTIRGRAACVGAVPALGAVVPGGGGVTVEGTAALWDAVLFDDALFDSDAEPLSFSPEVTGRATPIGPVPVLSLIQPR